MVHIFAGEEQHISNIKSLTEVLTSATLGIFQQGNKRLQRTFNLLLEKVLSCLILYLFHRSTGSS